MPNAFESLLFVLAVFVGPLVLHRFFSWYSKKLRYITSSIAIHAAFFAYWLANHYPQ